MKKLEDQPHEFIKAHIVNPENSPLPKVQQEQLDRLISFVKLREKNPTLNHAIKLHRSMYSKISLATAYRDAELAERLFEDMFTFDYDFWQCWLTNNIADNIQALKKSGTAEDRMTIAKEHANMIKAIGKPPAKPDPERNQPHEFYIRQSSIASREDLDVDELHKTPVTTIKELQKLLSRESSD